MKIKDVKVGMVVEDEGNPLHSYGRVVKVSKTRVYIVDRWGDKRFVMTRRTASGYAYPDNS